jgi:homocysteine S-methyltransferase
MQSDLVGAHELGLRDVLLTTGNPAPQGSYADATSVFDVDAIGLVNMIARLNRGLDIGGQSIGTPTQFHIGVAVNPFGPNPDSEWRRLAHKIEAGAEFLVTPPVLDLGAFDAELPRLQSTGLPIVAGVAALEGVRHLEFLASEVVGVRVSDALMERLRRAATPDAEALAVTIELARALRDRVHAIQITSVHGSPETTERLLMELQSAGVARDVGPAASHG